MWNDGDNVEQTDLLHLTPELTLQPVVSPFLPVPNFLGKVPVIRKKYSFTPEKALQLS